MAKEIFIRVIVELTVAFVKWLVKAVLEKIMRDFN